jgi:hypothetical protein
MSGSRRLAVARSVVASIADVPVLHYGLIHHPANETEQIETEQIKIVPSPSLRLF